VEVGGGVVGEVLGPALTPIEYEVLDWDNILPEIGTLGDTEHEWNRLSEALQDFVKAERPDEYAGIMKAIDADRKAIK
jgi:hypothetical protein